MPDPEPKAKSTKTNRNRSTFNFPFNFQLLAFNFILCHNDWMESDPFIAAIQAEPDDDLPRLIYADWLDEHGDPHGPFVRAQVALARLPADDPRRAEWAELEKALLAEHESAWVGDLNEEMFGWYFHRGFVEVKLDMARFLDYENKWLDLPMVAGVHLYAPRLMDLKKVEALGHHPRTQRVRSLDLGFEWLRDEGAKMLAASPYFNHLAALELNTNGIGDKGAKALAESENLPALQYLGLANNMITDVGAFSLAKAPQRAGLRRVDLSKNEITSVGFKQWQR
jgi:uncharacterized protein (TIGR02996 family)